MNIVSDLKEKMECKKTEPVTWREKKETWRKIEDAFNSQSFSGIWRSKANLKKMYDNQKN
jgi:Myb/SANT-like DNA-binding domain